MASIADYNQMVADAADEITIQNTNSVIAPAAFSTITAVTLSKAGLYEIMVAAGYGAVADVVDNMELIIGGVSGRIIIIPVQPVVNAERISVTLRVRVTSGQTIAVRSILAGAVTSDYRATIVAKRVLD